MLEVDAALRGDIRERQWRWRLWARWWRTLGQIGNGVGATGALW